MIGSIRTLARTAAARVVVLLAASLLASCGGGGGGGGVGTGGTGTDASTSTVTDQDIATGAAVPAVVVGPITGFGSIIVNGVRFETGSDIRAADEGAATAENDLRLGMMVEIRGNVAVDRAVGRASSVRWFSELRGAVGTVDAAARNLVVLGVPVQVSTSTVFAGVDSLASLQPGDVVEIYGLRDPTTNRLAATRIELERATGNAAPAEYKLRATVTNLNAAARQFNLGGVVVTYAPDVRIDPAPNGAGLANGQMVTVFSSQPGGATGTWPASRIQVRTLAGRLEGTAYGQVEGLVVGFVSPASFTVAGVTVDASRARFDGGTAADLANGVRVEVDGNVEAGRLIASRVKVERNDDDNESEREVRGPITAFQSVSNFTVRGESIDASQPGVQFERGTAADLVAGRTVQVRGRVRNAQLLATRVRFEDAAVSQSSDQASGQASGQGNGGQANGQGNGQASGQSTGGSREIELRGAASTVSGTGFVVGGRRVDASSANMQPGNAALVNGSLVDVRGVLIGDVLRATRVRVEAPEQGERVDARGAISSYVSPARFVVGGYTIDASRPDVRFDDGGPGNLRAGARVEVDGRLAGGVVVATRVRFRG